MQARVRDPGCIYAISSLFSGVLAFYDYFLKPHESQSHGPVAVPDGQKGGAYCAVNPENGVDIGYTVCAYHGSETDLDRIASPFIANGSSDCCLCGQCDEGILGPGVTAVDDTSPPNSNNFSVLACQVRSKTAVDGRFVCLAHRETEVQSSAKQALALFYFQPQLPTATPQDQTIQFVVTISVLAALVVVCAGLHVVFPIIYCCIKQRQSSRSSDLSTTVHGSGEKKNG